MRVAADMFTGIVKATGTVKEVLPLGGDSRLLIDAGGMDLSGCSEGDSIAVAGTCLTMLQPGGGRFGADVSAETLSLTTLGSLQAGQRVNLELALTLADRLGGHLVTGHVDGVARLVSRAADGRSEQFAFEIPGGLEKYVARKGSVCIDGVSLTVNDVSGQAFAVCVIPHTLASTTLGELLPGGLVNIEIDLLARYVERLDASGETPASLQIG